MKKLVAVVPALVVVFMLGGCGKSDERIACENVIQKNAKVAGMSESDDMYKLAMGQCKNL